ncbi:family 1 glycosylhydrolase [Spirillospora sp. CA-128828]|uniref:family 1 glycosylhydrolase n=1 Tax=Spirillospora sp. CA-128828 TaxID=3240033 RepID=UPI003D8F910D
MSDTDLREVLAGVDWGLSTSVSLAATSGGSPDFVLSDSSRRWSMDLAAVLGRTPTSCQLVAGWPYLQPTRPGHWDRAVLDRCDRRLDQLLDRGIKPGVTLLHVDMPRWADQSGGWLDRDTASRFADFAAGMGERFGDRVSRWTTVSDVLVHSVADYVAGMLPTGRGVGMRGLVALHHVLLGAGLAVRALRQTASGAEVGGSLTVIGGYAASDDIEDYIALERLESWAHRLLLDPMLLGRHMVAEGGRSPVEDSGCVRPGDMEAIAEPADVLGVVWHVPTRVAAPENLARLLPVRECFSALNDANRVLARLGFVLAPMEAVQTNRYGWPVVPEALADAVAALHDIYGDALPSLRIIDNGMYDLDPASDTDEERDRRQAGLTAQLKWLARVMAEGVEVSGYEYWSLMDNAPWKLRYTRHYAMAADNRQYPPQPAIPRDWPHQPAFGGPPPAGRAAKPGRRALYSV